MHCKLTSTKNGCSPWESNKCYLQSKQCLCLLLLENQEPDPTKSNQPSWVILEGPGHLAETAEYFLPERHLGRHFREEAQEGSSFLPIHWPCSSLFPAAWSNLIILKLWSLGHLIAECPFRLWVSFQIRIFMLTFSSSHIVFVFFCFKKGQSFKEIQKQRGLYVLLFLDSLLCEKVALWGKGSSRWPERAFEVSLKEQVYWIPVIEWASQQLGVCGCHTWTG